MAVDLSRLSVGELRARFVDGNGPVGPALLRRLERDPREGVRRLSTLLRRRRAEDRRARERLAAMLHFEQILWRSGLRTVAGVDEVGIGPLAGPVVAAAVVFPPGTTLAGIDDSKRLDPTEREEAAGAIRAAATGIGIGLAEVAEIDCLNVYHAGLLAMRRAIDALPLPPEHVLVDARSLPDLPMPQSAFVKGDGLDFSIAAASIVAKTHRDRLMTELDALHPGYGFARHKGYGTPEHQAAIRRHGPCPLHRRSFPYLRELRGECSEVFYALKTRLGALDSRAALATFEDELTGARTQLAEHEHRKLRLLLLRRWKVATAPGAV